MAIKPFNSVGGFSVGESPANVILANGDITTGNANLTANLYVTNTANVGNLRTDNILYANGTPWDFQEAAGNTWQIQYNVANNFAASANFTYDDSIQNLVILGNANVTKTFFGNIGSFTGNISALNSNLGNLATANYVNVANEINGNIANFSGNLTSLNANLGNLAVANYVNVASTLITSNLTTNTNVNFSSAGNVFLGNVSNLHITGGTPDQILKTDGSGNLSWSSGTSLANGFSNVTIPNANGNVYINANAGVDQQWVFGTDGNLTGPASGLADLGNLVIANFANIASNIITNNLTVNLDISGNTANFIGNITVLNANLGNLVTANFAEIASNTTTSNLTVNLELSGNTANFTGNISALNANLGNLAEANYVNVANEINGNIANFIGNLTSLNANLGNLAVANYVNVASNLITSNLTTNTNVDFTGASNVALGDVSNVHITGGTPDQILKTDGNGNLSWSSGTSLANGFSNVTIPNANGNVYINANAGVDQQWVFGTDGNLTGPAGGLADLGNLVIANFANIASNTTTSNLTVNLELSGNTANFTGNLTAANANLGNLATANFVNVSSNLQVTDTANVGNLRTDNLLYANGQPWDLQEAAGANTQIQYNDGNNDFGASSAFTFDYTGNILTVDGNANVTGTTITDQAQLLSILPTQVVYGNGSNYLVGSANFAFDDAVSNLIIIGNVIASSFVGNISGNIQAPGSNTQILFNDNNVTNAVANFSYDKAYNSGGGRLNVGNTVGGEIITDTFYANYANLGTANVTGNIVSSGNISTTGGGGNITMSGGNITGANVVSANTLSGNLSATSANITGNTTSNNLTVNVELSGNTANFSGNVIVPNLTVNLELSGNTANFTGNIIAANIVGALANGTSNVKVYQDANIEFTVGGSANVATIASTGLYVVGQINSTAGNMLSNGNITANGFLNSANANVTGEALLGSVKTANIVAPTGNLTISAAGTNENITLAPTGSGAVDVGLHTIIQLGAPVNPNDAATKEYVDTNSQGLQIHPAANVTSLTNLTATYFNGGTVLSVTTIASNTTITFSSNHGLVVNDDVTFTNTFNGITAGELYFVYSVPASNQITIKNGFFGAEITTLVNATGLTQPALGNGGVGATLTNSGTQVALTIDSVLMTVGARVLVQGQTSQLENGIYDVTTVGTGATNWVLTRSSDGDSYQPKSDTALCAGSYFFISQGSISAGSSYVLTSPPSEIEIGVDSIIFAQFSQAGAYTSGNGISINGTVISANIDGVTTAIVGGNIVVKAGANLTTPNLGDATFSSLSWNNLSNGNVTANNLSIGNVANITSNLTVGGIIQANGNISSNAAINGNTASFTNSANVGGNLLANNITSNNAFSTNTANVSSNLVTSNATVNLELSGNTANFSGNVILPNLTVNLELAGNTANFTGNVTALNANLGNLSTANYINVSQQINGNTATFTGNVQVENIVNPTANTSIGMGNGSGIVAIYSAGNATQFAPSGVITLGGASQVVGGTFGGSQLTLGTTQTDVVQNRGGNVTIQTGTGGSTNKTWTFAQDGTLYAPGNLNVNTIVSDNLKANLNVFVGNTTISWGTVTTTTISANQTIATVSTTGVTGLEFLIKGIDTTGTKYSMATVQAVTDGASVDYATFGTVNLGGQTGAFAVNVVAGNIELQVTPASSNSTVWTTQVRFI